MVRCTLYFIFASIFFLSCSNSSTFLEDAGRQYKHDKDFVSLEVIYSKLFKGMNRKEVENLLGKPDYSPIEGQYYYSSTRTEYSEDQEKEVIIGVVVNYNDSNGDPTPNLQDFWLGPIGE